MTKKKQFQTTDLARQYARLPQIGAQKLDSSSQSSASKKITIPTHQAKLPSSKEDNQTQKEDDVTEKDKENDKEKEKEQEKDKSTEKDKDKDMEKGKEEGKKEENAENDEDDDEDEEFKSQKLLTYSNSEEFYVDFNKLFERAVSCFLVAHEMKNKHEMCCWSLGSFYAKKYFSLLKNRKNPSAMQIEESSNLFFLHFFIQNNKFLCKINQKMKKL